MYKTHLNPTKSSTIIGLISVETSPKNRRLHSKVAQKTASRPTLKLTAQQGPKVAQLGGKLAQLATLLNLE